VGKVLNCFLVLESRESLHVGDKCFTIGFMLINATNA